MSYGGRGREWHPNFVEYVTQIVSHHNYLGMPAVSKADGDVDWTVPSNRKQGSQNWNGNELRREWWRHKASIYGIPMVGFWLRDTARANHPFGEKPCQTCGRVLQIAYVYPNKTLKRRIDLEFPELKIEWNEFPTIFDLLNTCADELGDTRAIEGFSKLLSFKGESEKSISELAETIQTKLVDFDEGPLSPGVMSNSPDRLDGFHTYNLCCRGNQDTGRSSANLNKYIVDRRAYEHWSQGDWALADQVMKSMPVGYCRGPAPCAAKKQKVQLTADHIGPISLGFRHTTIFNALCQSCNSAKNNRMSLSDVQQLLMIEKNGNKVISDHAELLWNTCSELVKTDQDALLLSRVMRINQEIFLRTLSTVCDSTHPVLLIPRLQLEHAANRISSIDFDEVSLELKSYEIEQRQISFAEKRVERVLRISFESIFGRNTEKRNVHLIEDYELDELDAELFTRAEAAQIPPEASDLNMWLLNLKKDNAGGQKTFSNSDITKSIQASASVMHPVDDQISQIMRLVQMQLIERFQNGDHRFGH